jgi:hypothetical protein
MSEKLLEEIIDHLNRHHQRATYTAVAAIVDRPETFLLRGRPRNYRNSWLVEQETGLPTGYEPAQLHPELKSNPDVIATGDALRNWLADARSEPTSH